MRFKAFPGLLSVAVLALGLTIAILTIHFVRDLRSFEVLTYISWSLFGLAMILAQSGIRSASWINKVCGGMTIILFLGFFCLLMKPAYSD